MLSERLFVHKDYVLWAVDTDTAYSTFDGSYRRWASATLFVCLVTTNVLRQRQYFARNKVAVQILTRLDVGAFFASR